MPQTGWPNSHHNNMIWGWYTEIIIAQGSCIFYHYSDVMTGAMASQIPGISIIYSSLGSGADQRKHQSSVSLAFERGIHRWQVNSPHKGPVTRKMSPFDDVIMFILPLEGINLSCIPKWKYFPCYWTFVRGIHPSPVNSPHKGQWHGALAFSLICTWINSWINNREAGDARCHRAHCDLIVMSKHEGNWALFQYQNLFPDMGLSIIKISWTSDCLIFIVNCRIFIYWRQDSIIMLNTPLPPPGLFFLRC